jgi:antitoxin MazE
VIGGWEPVTPGPLRAGPPVGTSFVRRYNTVAMIKKLSAVGNSLGLIIERPILELLNITKDTALEIKTDGEALIIRPVRITKKERVRESARRMMAVHDDTLRKLAK